MINGQNIELSIVVPVLNEADNLMPLYEEICQTVNDRYNCEIIFIIFQIWLYYMSFILNLCRKI